MRMRQLGYGQSVRFFSPPEVHNKLLEHTGKEGGDDIRTSDIIEWVIHETCSQTQKSIPLWASQGIGHQARQSAWDQYFESNDHSTLTEVWQQPEFHTLEEMYGVSDTQKHSIVRVINEQLTCSSLRNRHAQLQTIRERCEEFEITSLQDVSVQEEQEREVSNEVEREQQVEPPGPARPAQHHLHPELITFIKTGITSNRSTVFMPMMNALQGTSFYTMVEHGPWATTLLATIDFVNTVEPRTNADYDDYLRPVSWIVSSSRVGKKPILCLFSPYEVNELLPLIQNSKWVNLHMYSPKVHRQTPTFEDLNYATIPALSCHYSFPGQDQLMMQLNLFSGQLFFKSYESYTAACDFLGIYLRHASNEVLPVGVGVDGFLPGWRKNNIDSNIGIVGVAFQKCPIGFLKHLMAVRRKGMKYESTHMGLLVHARQLREEEFQ